jgi:hypothetical protein
MAWHLTRSLFLNSSLTCMRTPQDGDASRMNARGFRLRRFVVGPTSPSPGHNRETPRLLLFHSSRLPPWRKSSGSRSRTHPDCTSKVVLWSSTAVPLRFTNALANGIIRPNVVVKSSEPDDLWGPPEINEYRWFRRRIFTDPVVCDLQAAFYWEGHRWVPTLSSHNLALTVTFRLRPLQPANVLRTKLHMWPNSRVTVSGQRRHWQLPLRNHMATHSLGLRLPPSDLRGPIILR